MMSLVYRKGLKKNGTNPVMLIGYGSYGITIEPSYWDSDGAFLAKGGIKAVAHIRGGVLKSRAGRNRFPVCFVETPQADFYRVGQ